MFPFFPIGTYSYALLALLSSDVQNSHLEQFNFNFENDFKFETDKFYNHSSKFDFIFQSSADKKIKYNLSYRNEMYTPEEHELTYIQPGDMQYTGFSEISAGINLVDDTRFLSAQIGIGYTGKYTGGKEIMEFVHTKLPAKPEFNGWDTQETFTLEARITLANKHKFRINNYFDYIHDSGLTLSTLRSVVNTGGMFRAGLLSNDFGVYNSKTDNLNVVSNSSNIHAYVFGGYNLKYTFNDYTLRGLDMIHGQYDYKWGVGVKYNNWSLNLSEVIESKQFKTQSTDSFGYSNIMLTYLY